MAIGEYFNFIILKRKTEILIGEKVDCHTVVFGHMKVLLHHKFKHGALGELVKATLAHQLFAAGVTTEKEIKQQIEQIAKGPKMKKYFNSYNDFTGEYDPYLFNINTLTKAIRKDKSTNLFTIDKSKLPGSIRQTYETISGDMVNNLALIENVIEDINSTQITDNIIDENAMDMEKHK